MDRGVRLEAIWKSYGALIANKGVDLSLRRGEIHALLGENGAGKTTLMRILFGEVAQDSGQVYVDGVAREIDSPADALKLGIAMVHQHFMLVPSFSVAENVILGTRSPALGKLDMAAAEQAVADRAEQIGFDLDPRQRVGELTVDMQQAVEVVKALYRGADTLILDEPTSTLGPTEVDRLFRVLRHLKSNGCTIVMITHKLGEAVELADRTTVLRNGEVVARGDRGELGVQELAAAMVGDRHGVAAVAAAERRSGAPVTGSETAGLAIRGLEVEGDHGTPAVDGLDLTVRRGEIVGVAGVAGNGQRELAEALIGVRPIAAGQVMVAGQDVAGGDPQDVRAAGVSGVSEDRLRWDLIADFDLAENMALSQVAGGEFTKRGVLDRAAMAASAEGLLADFDVFPRDPGAIAGELSGGNQQKVVMARELGRNPQVLVAAQPTRGIDIAAAEFVHGRLVALREQGCAVVLISLDLDELQEFADRIIVLYRGRVALDADASAVMRDEIAAAMAGLGEDQSREQV